MTIENESRGSEADERGGRGLTLRSVLALGVLLAPLVAPSPATGQELSFVGTCTLPSGPDQVEGIGFDHGSGNLLIATAGSTTVYEISPSCALLGSFTLAQQNPPLEPTGVHVLSSGNLLVAESQADRVLEFTASGALVPGGIGCTLPARPEGVVLDAVAGSLFVVTRDSGRIQEFDETSCAPSGDLSAGGAVSPQGLSLDPSTGNFFVVDKDDRLALVDRATGNPLTTVDLLAFLDQSNPQGVTFDPATSRVFVGSDDVPAQLATFQLPEPSAWLLHSAALAFLLALVRARAARSKRIVSPAAASRLVPPLDALVRHEGEHRLRLDEPVEGNRVLGAEREVCRREEHRTHPACEATGEVEEACSSGHRWNVIARDLGSSASARRWGGRQRTLRVPAPRPR